MWTLIVACATPEPPPPPAPTADEVAMNKARTQVAAAEADLLQRMVQELGATGPSDAVEEGSMEAEALAPSTMPHDASGSVGRSSLRLRDPSNKAPAWVQVWLDEQGERSYADAKGFERFADTPEGRFARVLQPIPVHEACLTCHGPEEELAADVRARLDATFPGDRARGYRVGDLRGAVWAEIEVQ